MCFYCSVETEVHYTSKVWSQYVLLEYTKLIKSDSKDIYDVTKHFYIKNDVLLNFLFIKKL